MQHIKAMPGLYGVGRNPSEIPSDTFKSNQFMLYVLPRALSDTAEGMFYKYFIFNSHNHLEKSPWKVCVRGGTLGSWLEEFCKSRSKTVQSDFSFASQVNWWQRNTSCVCKGAVQKKMFNLTKPFKCESKKKISLSKVPVVCMFFC